MPSEITPLEVFKNRRQFIQKIGLGLSVGGISTIAPPLFANTITSSNTPSSANGATRSKALQFAKTSYGAGEKLNTYNDIITYNNFYEFGTSKSEPAMNSKLFKPYPWTLSIEGEIKKPKTISIEDLYKLAPLEERIYRMRCVEGWSMVVPWVGLPLAQLIKWAEPTSNAKYIEFISLADSQQMDGINLPILDWPYTKH